MDAINELLIWADSKGIVLNGIHPKALSGRGIGLLATRDLKVSHYTNKMRR